MGVGGWGGGVFIDTWLLIMLSVTWAVMSRIGNVSIDENNTNRRLLCHISNKLAPLRASFNPLFPPPPFLNTGAVPVAVTICYFTFILFSILFKIQLLLNLVLAMYCTIWKLIKEEVNHKQCALAVNTVPCPVGQLWSRRKKRINLFLCP